MIGFHIDMNVAQFTRSYLEKWLSELARLGYDTILWEVENNIQWDTCPQCVSAEAFSKAEFREILDRCRSLGLESIPLFQTLGHCEYVLKHPAYRHLAEQPDRMHQYCPTNPQVLTFLHQWIEEYIELFGDVQRFHLGADEACNLAACDRCRMYAAEHSRSELYVQHINAVADVLQRRGIRPMIWADMVLHFPESLDRLSREIGLCDWMYEIYRGNGKVFVWGKGVLAKDQLPAETVQRFGPFLFPDGDGPGREPQTFYTADYLAAAGFDVLTCPASSSYGDNVFTPRSFFHLSNTFDSFSHGMKTPCKGSILTSWTVHLFPYELQRACIAVPGTLHRQAHTSLQAFQRHFVQTHFKTDDLAFFRACDRLSKCCLFTYTASLGYYKDCKAVPIDHVIQRVGQLTSAALVEEIGACSRCLAEYTEALQVLQQFAAVAQAGRDDLAMWDLAARNLISRAKASEFILKHALAVRMDLPIDSAFAAQGWPLLAELQALRDETRRMYTPILKPDRRECVIAWLFSAMEYALARCVRG